MNNVKKQIAVTKENREFLARAFEVTDVMVWKALNYKSDTDLARRIRKLAVERGGDELIIAPVGSSLMDCIETLHDNDGYIRQYLPNGAMIEFSKDSGSGDVFYKGENRQHYNEVGIRDISRIQKFAMALA